MIRGSSGSDAAARPSLGSLWQNRSVRRCEKIACATARTYVWEMGRACPTPTSELLCSGRAWSLSEIEFGERKINNLRKCSGAQVIDSTFENSYLRQTPCSANSAEPIDFFTDPAGTINPRRTGKNAYSTVEMTSYHERDGVRVTGEFLRNDGCEVVTRALSDEERGSKGKMLTCFVTQERVLSWFPIVSERYRVAPRYDFTQPPHPGTLHYEHFGWGITGERWRALAKAALEELGLEGAI
jgi:hypothetical protein